MEALEVIRLYKEHSLDRRSALKALFKLGVSAPVAYSSLGILSASTEAANARTAEQSVDTIQALAKNLFRLISSPEMANAMDQAQRLGRDQAASILAQTAYNQALWKRYDLKPDELRTSMRIFDKSSDKDVTLGRVRGVGTSFVFKNTGVVTEEEALENAAKGGSTFAKEQLNRLRNRGGVPPEDIGDLCLNCGLCVSYGRDLCVSAGIP